MDKQQVISVVLKELGKKKLELQDSVENFRKSAGEQSKSIESWSDSSRAQLNMMAGAIQNDVSGVESAMIFLKTIGVKTFIAAESGALIEVRENDRKKLYFIVPEGAGGFAVEMQGKEVLVIAITSPLGSILFGKKTGETAVFSTLDGNIKNFKIIKVS